MGVRGSVSASASGGGATSRCYLTDALGSISAMVSPTGTAVRTYRYTPWGETTTATGTIPNPFTYAGGYQETYQPTGTTLIKFGTRYYQPNLGRWTQIDAIASEPRYAYVSNDPLNMVDPSGRDGECSHVPDSIGGIYDFHDECVRHDACYDLHGDNAITCDFQFYEDTVGDCSAWDLLCESAAEVFSAAVLGNTAVQNIERAL